MDKITPEQRHYTMSRIRGKDTKPEILVRQFLFREGFRIRKNAKRYAGHPDIVLPKYRTMVFVNGCFWHGHEGCRYYVMPKSNIDFWASKIERNKARDKKDRETLESMGWNVLTIWECELDRANREESLKTLALRIKEYLIREEVNDQKLFPEILRKCVRGASSSRIGTDGYLGQVRNLLCA